MCIRDRPNIARCLSVVGVARELAALTGATLRLPDSSFSADTAPIDARAQLTVETVSYTHLDVYKRQVW